MAKVVFVTGIDTDCGKSVVTGLIARWLNRDDRRVITQKMIQTGCEYISEDIETHRSIMGVELMHEDLDSTTCPYIFPFAASPHLSAKLVDTVIDPEVIDSATAILKERYDSVIIEAAGGIYVPITEEYTTLDFLTERKLPTVVVSSTKLGSINHTLLTLNSLKGKNIDVIGVAYNYLEGCDMTIAEDSKNLIERELKKLYPNASLVSVPSLNSIAQDDIIEFPFIKA